MMRISKGDIAIDCETQAELQIAIACLTEMMRGYEPQPLPEWRVGGPPDVEVLRAQGQYPADTISLPDDVPSGRMSVDMGFIDTESDDSDEPFLPLATVGTIAPQHIPVSVKNMAVLDAVMLFPEGITVKGVSSLTGLEVKTVGGRMQMLKSKGLVELIPHKLDWRATQLARRAKLVAA